MLIAGALLCLLAVALAWPIPLALSRARWPERSPALAMVLWQSIAASGGLSMIGGLVLVGASPAGSISGAIAQLLPALTAGPLPPAFAAVHLAALTLAIGLAVHLVLNVLATAVTAERTRRRQHRMVALLSEPLPGEPEARLLDHPVPIAYCVPGIRTAMVLTDGLVRLLEPAELRAVIAHERAHLEQGHHLVLLSFRAWHSALPWFPIANRAESAVTMLTELLADDRAQAVEGTAALKSALARVGSDAEPGAYAESGGPQPDAELHALRLARLTHAAAPLAAAARAAIVALAVLLVAVPLGAVVAAVLA